MTEQLHAKEDAQINYYINQSVPTLTKQMMETVANKLNEQVNQQVRETVNTQLVEMIPQMVVNESPSEEMEVVVKGVASQVVELVQENSKITPVQGNVIKKMIKKDLLSPWFRC